jgi:hypothetical protein
MLFNHVPPLARLGSWALTEERCEVRKRFGGEEGSLHTSTGFQNSAPPQVAEEVDITPFNITFSSSILVLPSQKSRLLLISASIGVHFL